MLLLFWHVAQEVFYNDNFTSYKLCEMTGEDPTCSDSLIIPISVYEHLHYFNTTVSTAACWGNTTTASSLATSSTPPTAETAEADVGKQFNN